MNWLSEIVLKFLELYQINSCIWNPQNEFHKNRQRVNDAWINIKENLRVPCTIKDLKKKKESLMSAYRGYKNKVKKSERSGSGTSDVYQPTWFAYSLMDSFLGSVYSCNPTVCTRDEETIEESFTGQDSIGDSSESNIEQELNNSSAAQRSSVTPTPPAKRRQHNPPELVKAKKQMDQAFNFMQQVSQQQQQPKDDDDCFTFGTLVGKKLRKVPEERKDVIMLKIHQIFVDEQDNEYNRRLNSCSSCTYSASTQSPQQHQMLEVSPPFEGQDTYYTQSASEDVKPTVNENAGEGSIMDEREQSVPTSFSMREYNNISPTIYDGSALSLKDFIIFKQK